MNPLQRLLVRLGLEAPLEVLADRISAACAETVASRLTGDASIKSLSEARGYIRARAATTIDNHVSAISGITNDCRQHLHSLIAERLARQFAPQIAQQPAVQRKAA